MFCTQVGPIGKICHTRFHSYRSENNLDGLDTLGSGAWWCSSFISCAVSHVLPLQEHVHLTERWSLWRLAVPTLDHQVVDLAWTVGWLAEHNPLQVRVSCRGVVYVLVVITGAVLDDLVVCQWVEWTLASECQGLPQRDSERPHVTLRWKLALLFVHTVTEIYANVILCQRRPKYLFLPRNAL